MESSPHVLYNIMKVLYMQHIYFSTLSLFVQIHGETCFDWREINSFSCKGYVFTVRTADVPSLLTYRRCVHCSLQTTAVRSFNRWNATFVLHSIQVIFMSICVHHPVASLKLENYGHRSPVSSQWKIQYVQTIFLISHVRRDQLCTDGWQLNMRHSDI